MSENRKETPCACHGGVTRRGFLTTSTVGVGAMAVGATTAVFAKSSEKPQTVEPDGPVRCNLHINGRDHVLLVEPRWSLLFVLRERLGLTGTKVGCERGECGACTVLMDNVPRYSCLTLALEAEGSEIVTLEGLMDGEKLGAVQQAFLEHDAFQCGYCTPGQVMSVEGLLRKEPSPSLEDIRVGVSGNLCRCGAYVNIFKAAGRAADIKAGKGGGS